MKTVIEMAREVGFSMETSVSIRAAERFAELVRAEAIAEEREACAKVCDDWPNGRDDVYSIGEAIRERSANARARGNT